jgi:lipoyl(octanoyl) transferase
MMHSAQSRTVLQTIDLDRLGYAEALAYQKQVHAAVVAGQRGPALLLVEHDPVITLPARRGVRKHLLASDERLAALGVDVQTTDRGGDITYHGPGQLVAYPIIRLAPAGLNLGSYMRLLEAVVMATLQSFGIASQREAGATGVWTTASATQKPAKIAAMGVRIARNTTRHGLAMNVEPNMGHYELIVPCGLADRAVTSMAELLGQDMPTMAQVKAELVKQMHASLKCAADQAPGVDQ